MPAPGCPRQPFVTIPCFLVRRLYAHRPFLTEDPCPPKPSGRMPRPALTTCDQTIGPTPRRNGHGPVARPSGLNPWGLNPWGLNPWGLNPWGLNPWGLNPWGLSPGGLNPGGLNPGGLNPWGLNPW